MSENKQYTLHRHQAADLIARLSTALSWTDDVVSVDLGEVDHKGCVNVYVDGLLTATLRPFKEEA
jgi:hypothetical protein